MDAAREQAQDQAREKARRDRIVAEHDLLASLRYPAKLVEEAVTIASSYTTPESLRPAGGLSANSLRHVVRLLAEAVQVVERIEAESPTEATPQIKPVVTREEAVGLNERAAYAAREDTGKSLGPDVALPLWPKTPGVLYASPEGDYRTALTGPAGCETYSAPARASDGGIPGADNLGRVTY